MNVIANAPVYDARAVKEVLRTEHTEDQLAAFGRPPDALPGFITFFDPGLSIVDLRAGVEILSHHIFYPQTWYDTESFAKRKESPRYRQLQMGVVKYSFGKPFAEQQTLVPPGMEIPTARVVLTAMAIHFLATGERLFSDCYVRSVDQNSDGGRVVVGVFASDGFDVSGYWDDDRGSDIGLASSRKF